MSKSSNGKGGGKRAALIVLCVFLALILATLLGGTLYANHLMGLVNRVDGNQETLSQEQLDTLLSDETVADGDTNPVMKEDDIDWGTQDGTGSGTGKNENVLNILLIGQDARPGQGRQRSDSMILCTLNKDTKTITLTSFLRDLYVQIPGYSDNKLNAAFAAGGTELLKKTLNTNFGVQVDGTVEVNFARFEELFDLLGGVDLELRADEADVINRSASGNWLSAGMMHLNGAQALEYARIRYLDRDADFSRTNRQRKVITALIEKFRETKLTALLGILEEALPMLTTDLSNGEIVSYAMEYFPVLANCTVVSQRVPADGAYTLATIRGMSCVVADMDAARQLLRETIGANG